MNLLRIASCTRRGAAQGRTLLAAAVVLLWFAQYGSAWSPQQKAFRRHHTSTMYMPPSSPTTQPPSLIAQKMLKNPGNPRIKQDPRPNHVQLSNSVLASCDTLPSFPTAHGLLSPETVMRLEESIAEDSRSKPLQDFLKSYRRHGPLSCLPMLSNPNVLPHLTQAMREVVA